ncbi:hypothetical protein M892_03200 [Vibrio campbellii ATCC BAA-1116]|uniref:Uncharacterized protein n=2 Tax=Vibrio campbellii TaxID=680 RepID=A7MW81_VIBC1|nr:hypothetical protein VIBHAR_02008 [Vibrio campbellii ATCC BAA-1116]AGU96146.1 hypothetical protein M892_03200 [Vibrio campbellii ATCC BAA-1116]
MSHEFGLIEGNFHNLEEADIASAIPAHLTFDQLKHHLHEGKLVLVSDTPQIPALLSYNDPIGPKTWRLNSEVISAFSDDATKELLAKTKIPRATGGYSTRIVTQSGILSNIRANADSIFPPITVNALFLRIPS